MQQARRPISCYKPHRTIMLSPNRSPTSSSYKAAISNLKQTATFLSLPLPLRAAPRGIEFFLSLYPCVRTILDVLPFQSVYPSHAAQYPGPHQSHQFSNLLCLAPVVGIVRIVIVRLVRLVDCRKEVRFEIVIIIFILILILHLDLWFCFVDSLWLIVLDLIL